LRHPIVLELVLELETYRDRYRARARTRLVREYGDESTERQNARQSIGSLPNEALAKLGPCLCLVNAQVIQTGCILK